MLSKLVRITRWQKFDPPSTCALRSFPWKTRIGSWRNCRGDLTTSLSRIDLHLSANNNRYCIDLLVWTCSLCISHWFFTFFKLAYSYKAILVKKNPHFVDLFSFFQIWSPVNFAMQHSKWINTMLTTCQLAMCLRTIHMYPICYPPLYMKLIGQQGCLKIRAKSTLNIVISATCYLESHNRWCNYLPSKDVSIYDVHTTNLTFVGKIWDV
jgi:hypothetical protein